MRQQVPGIILVGPNVLFREGLTRILSAAKFRIVASACHVADLPFASLSQQQPTLLLIDGGDDPGVAVGQIEPFRARRPNGFIAVLAHRFQLSAVVSAFQEGAHAFFVGITSSEAFVESLKLVILGEMILPPEILPFLLGQGNDDEDRRKPALNWSEIAQAEPISDEGSEYRPRLSPRENFILRRLTEGATNKAIARRMDIAETTVKVHVKAILRKIRVRNRTQAAIWAMNNGSHLSTMDPIPERSGSDRFTRLLSSPESEGHEKADHC